MLDKIKQLAADAMDDLSQVRSADDLEQFRIKYLGSKGAMKDLMGMIKDVPKEMKREFGQGANALRQQLEEAFGEKKEEVGSTASSKAKQGPQIDVTEPGLPPRLGRRHVITQTIDELIEVFGRMGFDVATGPEIEDDYHNFIALNIPPEHPARAPEDNFYLDEPGRDESEHLLRSQTSTIQIRVMEKTKPPVRVVAMGRVYRPDEHDATHYSMFHQVEGLYVDKGVTMSNLKSTLLNFAHAYWGSDAEVRLRPSYFPFTEPSAEIEVKMTLGGKERWIEVGGCGMVDPNVFEAVGYDAEQWTGWAFGLGIERLAMRKYDIHDIRWLFENDARFLRQF